MYVWCVIKFKVVYSIFNKVELQARMGREIIRTQKIFKSRYSFVLVAFLFPVHFLK